jgi:hypothetical protein
MKIWFEIQIDDGLAGTLQRICDAYRRRGKVSRAAFLERLNAAIPAAQQEKHPEWEACK